MSLTHIQITHAKPASRAYKLADADALYLVVNPNGTKLYFGEYCSFYCPRRFRCGQPRLGSISVGRVETQPTPVASSD